MKHRAEQGMRQAGHLQVMRRTVDRYRTALRSRALYLAGLLDQPGMDRGVRASREVFRLLEQGIRPGPGAKIPTAHVQVQVDLRMARPTLSPP